MFKKFYISAVCIASLSCTPDFDPNADWEAIDVMYSILNPDDSIQYVQVNRLFQNKNANALDIAKIEDSIYHTDSITVSLTRLGINGENLGTVNLKKEYFENKEIGIFPNPGHYLYTFKTKDFAIYSGESYELKVTNNETDKVSFGETKVINNFSIIKPANADVLVLYNKGKFLNPKIEFSNIDDKKLILNIDITIPIYELSGGDTVSKDTLIYTVVGNYSYTGGGAINNLEISGEGFITTVASNLPPISSELNYRVIDLMTLNVRSYGEEMLEYVSAEKSFSSISQTKPFYTNIYDKKDMNEQVGIFTSYKYKRTYLLLSPGTMEYFKDNYPELGF